ncbi:Glycosyltransferase family 10 (fucosyltransferase) [Roseimaritima multifibrata]|uniref:Glycosyltransferase family 10 (Fucosyltransferase) n=1 Tax=Roseimaritima multifibrata TaxID=1930274 RepID=A0A517MN62_9BACT|nr:glycosyltransferase family 10 [Roseimaritima multifibrata]QDS96325.1 Glycosyltransferase family 10 (fucosyltransferase) [Roseimaritima multifibrata]
MPRVLVTTPFPDWPLLRQTPGGKGVWEDFQFVVNEPLESCDAWVVYEEVPERMTVNVPPDQTYFFSAEPPALRRYRECFVAQFRWFITCHSVRHPRRLDYHQAHPWHVGVDRDQDERAAWGYDEIADSAPEKSGLISAVISTKAITPDHVQRQRFVSMLKEALGDDFHLYGRGFREIADKWDAIAPYRFHLALENQRLPNYMTEKLSDAFLASAYPFYYGCQNVGDYFSEEAFTAIDIHKPEAAIEEIQKAIQEERDRKAAEAVITQRQRVLDEHNFFPLMVQWIRERQTNSPAKKVELLPRKNRFKLWCRQQTNRLVAS